MESRRATRQGFAIANRVTLLEDDADTHDEDHEDIRADIKGTNRLLVGMMVTVTMASLGIAAKLVLGG